METNSARLGPAWAPLARRVGPTAYASQPARSSDPPAASASRAREMHRPWSPQLGHSAETRARDSTGQASRPKLTSAVLGSCEPSQPAKTTRTVGVGGAKKTSGGSFQRGWLFVEFLDGISPARPISTESAKLVDISRRTDLACLTQRRFVDIRQQSVGTAFLRQVCSQQVVQL